jgi:hypothetical protein
MPRLPQPVPVGDERLGLTHLSHDELLERDRQHANRDGHVPEVRVGRLPWNGMSPLKSKGIRRTLRSVT